MGNQVPFRALLKQERKLQASYQQKKLKIAFDHNYHLKNVDMIFDRLGLNDKVK